MQSGARNTVEHWARHGIAGRAILLDVLRALARGRTRVSAGRATVIGIEELELARRRAGVRLRGRATSSSAYRIRGLVHGAVRTGQGAHHGRIIAPGLAHREAMADTSGTRTPPPRGRHVRRRGLADVPARPRTRSAFCTACSSASSGWPSASCGGSRTSRLAPPTASTRLPGERADERAGGIGSPANAMAIK